MILFVFAIIWGRVKLPRYDRTVSMDAVRAGELINEQLDQFSVDRVPNYMVELVFWDFLGVKTAGGYYDHFLYDREYDIYNRNTESIFSDGDSALCSVLASQNVKFLALRTENLRSNAETLICLQQLEGYGMWTIYEVIQD